LKYNVLLIEDDEMSVALIKRNLSFYPAFSVFTVVNTIAEAIQFTQNNHVDVVFLDIQLPDGNGFDVIQHLYGKPAIIVVTSDESYAFTAFEHGVLDFLKKGIMPNRFKVCVDKIMTYLQNQIPPKAEESTFLFVKSGLKHLKIDIRELLYAEAENEYVRIFIEKNKSFLINISLKQLVNKLQGYHFIQVHRTYLVNLQHIDYVDDGMVILNNTKQIPIGKTFKNEVLKILK
jgi:two-component system LytT family response regulator